ncbi:MAG TPA: PTS sugar transporter subunit IIB [Myxococcales bacterium]|nr:PTS sugar transporter subunit IIB [Myxococcales bacterium]
MKSAPPGISLVRVDNRLVHGQVLEAWLPALDAHGVLVADDEAAGNVLARSAMSLAIPPRVKFEVLRVQAAAELLKPGGKGPSSPRTLVLLRDVRDAAALHDAGVPIPQLNLGNVHFAAGRKQVSHSVFLDAAELDALERLAAQGTQVEARAVPSETPVPLEALRTRFASA